LFAKLYINNQIVTTNRGPLRIKKDLLDKGVSNSIIDEELDEFREDVQLEKIDKVINKSIKSNHSRGGVILKSKIFNDLKTLGYDSSIINKIINDYDYSDNKDLYKKEYDKLYRKLSKKYEGKELEYKINERLYQKGLYYEK
jgi:regulatory protein